MNTAVINIKTDPILKAKAKKVAGSLGFSLSSLINGYLNHLVDTKTVFFSKESEEPSDYLIKILKESKEEEKRGEYLSFNSFDDALKYVDSVIKDKTKKRQVHKKIRKSTRESPSFSSGEFLQKIATV